MKHNAFITGAGKGIGEAIAVALAGEGQVTAEDLQSIAWWHAQVVDVRSVTQHV